MEYLEELSGEHGCSIHAYVLMTNHVHLLLTPEQPDSVSVMMKNLGQRYVQRFNRKQGRTGTLWEGRFRSSVIDSEGYLFQCHRYIETNPVRAEMVRRPREYEWSSHRVNAEGKLSRLITPHPLYLSLGSTGPERLASYRALFEADLSELDLKEIRDATNGGFALGRAAFLSNLERLAERRVTPAPAGRRQREMESGTDLDFPPRGKSRSVPEFST
jgi:putative transposase